MKTVIILCVALLAGTFLIEQSAASGFKPVQTEAEFKKLLAGKKWVNRKNGTTATVHRNHTLSGRIGGKRFYGKWSWKGKFMCRSFRISGKTLGKGCVAIKHASGRYMAIWNKGRGKKVVYHRR